MAGLSGQFRKLYDAQLHSIVFDHSVEPDPNERSFGARSFKTIQVL